MKRYAAYEGDRLIGKGSIMEVAELFGIAESTARRLCTPRHIQSVKGQKSARYILNLNFPLQYEVYRGYNLIARGTIDQLAAELKIKPQSVRFMTSPAHLKRMGESENFLHVIKVDDEEEEGIA